MTLADMRWDIILGGFGMFMFGINFMGDGLKEIAGDKLRVYIDKYTANPFSAFLIGIIITIIMQSSSASTAITIGMVRAGLMTLEQAAGIVMGANIGTTITSFLISLDIGQYILYVVFLGAMLISFSKNRKVKCLGNILLGFGFVFYGLDSMGGALSSLKDMPAFTAFAEKMSENPFLSLLAGTVMTGAVQASAATIGVVQKMYEAGALTFKAVLPFVFGANIGTTVTGILAAIGGSTAAKRTAGIHTLFNIVGSTIGMLFLVPLSSLILFIAGKLNLNPMMQVALSHIMFNTIATIIFFPFLKQMCAVVRKIIPGEEPKRLEVDVNALDPKLAEELPTAALSAAGEALCKMAEAVKDNVSHTRDFLNVDHGEEQVQLIEQSESLINSYDAILTKYLVDVGAAGKMTAHDAREQRLQLDIVKNLERIGDLSMNLKEFFEMITSDNKHMLSASAVYEINRMYEQLQDMLDTSMEIYRTKKPEDFARMEELEDGMDNLELRSRNQHFTRMASGKCVSPVASSVYCDILGNLERMGDHCWNIARGVMTGSVDDLGEGHDLGTNLL